MDRRSFLFGSAKAVAAVTAVSYFDIGGAFIEHERLEMARYALVDDFTREALMMLENNLKFTGMINRKYDERWATMPKAGPFPFKPMGLQGRIYPAGMKESWAEVANSGLIFAGHAFSDDVALLQEVGGMSGSAIQLVEPHTPEEKRIRMRYKRDMEIIDG